MFRSFKQRSTESELMDDQHIGYNFFQACLHDLAIVNVLTFAYRPTLRWLKQTIRINKLKRPLSIIDVGCGGGDTLRHIAVLVNQKKLQVELLGIDLNPWSKKYADQVTPPALNIKFETNDIFKLDSSQQADFIISSLFTHHLNDQQLVAFLEWMEAHATYGWFINDLHRHPVAYYLFKYISYLFRFDPMVQHDGAISVARAFTKTDWLHYLSAASIPLSEVEVRWFFPFRYCITRRKQ